MNKLKPFILFFIIIILSGNLLAQLNEGIQTNPGNITESKISKYEHFTLDNGLKVIVVEDHKKQTIFYQLIVDAGPVMEKNSAGYVSMSGELIRSGTTNKSKIEIDNAINVIKAGLNTYKNGMDGLTPKKHKDEFLSIMSEVLLNPSFPELEIENAKRQSISGLASSKTGPAFIANRVGKKLRNFNHPYGEIATKETIESITREHLVEYYKTYYKPNSSYLIIVGDITLNEAKTDAERYFGAWEKGNAPKHEYQFPNKNIGTRVILIHKDSTGHSYINVTYPVNLKFGASNAVPAILGNDVFSAKLLGSLQNNKGYTNVAYSNLTKDPLAGNFAAFVQVKTEDTDDAINQFIIEMNRMKNELVDDETLSHFKTVKTESFVRSLEYPQTIASLAFNTLKYNLPFDYYKSYPERINAVTKEEIQAVSKKYIDPNQAIIVVVGDKAKLKESLKKYSSKGIVELYDTNGNPLKEETKKEIPDGVTAKTVLDNYIKALGGVENLEKIQDLTMVATSNMNGMEIKQKIYRKAPNKYAMTMSMNGNNMMQQVFNGERGIMKSFHGEQKIVGADLENLKISATLNAELKYEELGIKVTLEAIEAIDKKDAYKVKVVNPTGEITFEYFDVESGLKVQSKQVIVVPQGEFTQMQDYSDYKEINQVKFPFKIRVSGVQNMELKVDSLTVNTNLSDDLF